MDMKSAFTLTVRPDNVAVVAIDVPDEKMNTLKAELGARYGQFSNKSVRIKLCGRGDYLS
ncbi:hypothetical protein ACLK2H_13405 [Escherichia coli]